MFHMDQIYFITANQIKLIFPLTSHSIKEKLN